MSKLVVRRRSMLCSVFREFGVLHGAPKPSHIVRTDNMMQNSAKHQLCRASLRLVHDFCFSKTSLWSSASGLETLTHRSGVKSNADLCKNHLRRAILRPFRSPHMFGDC